MTMCSYHAWEAAVREDLLSECLSRNMKAVTISTSEFLGSS